MFFTMESRWGHDRVRGFVRRPRAELDGGRPVEIGSHLAPHLRVYTVWGVNHQSEFYFGYQAVMGSTG